MSCFSGITGLSTHDLSICNCRIRQILKHGTVESNSIRMNIGSRCRMIRTLYDLTECIIFQSIFQKHCNIPCGTVMICIMQSRRITEVRTGHPKFCRFFVHQCHKIRLRTGNRVRKCNAAFCSGRKHHTIKQIDCTDSFARLKSCLRRILLIQTFKHLICQCDLLLQIFEIFNCNNRRHDLCHRCRIHLFFSVDLTDHPAATYLHQHCIRTVDTTDIQLFHNRFTHLLDPVKQLRSHTIIPANNQYKYEHHDQLYCNTENHSSSILFFASSRLRLHRPPSAPSAGSPLLFPIRHGTPSLFFKTPLKFILLTFYHITTNSCKKNIYFFR